MKGLFGGEEVRICGSCYGFYYALDVVDWEACGVFYGRWKEARVDAVWE